MTQKFFKTVLSTVLILGLLFAFGIRVEHPKSGLRSALGAASTSIAVYHRTTNVSVGSKVLANLPSGKDSPTLAFVRGVDKSTVDLQSGSQMERIQRTEVRGKLIAILPFFGTLLGFVGL